MQLYVALDPTVVPVSLTDPNSGFPNLSHLTILAAVGKNTAIM